MKKGQTYKPINRIGNSIKKCTSCLVILNDQNWYKHSRKIGEYTCIKCRKLYDSKYASTRVLNTTRDGKNIYLSGDKRPKTIECELCNKVPLTQLAYHHWNDKDIRQAVWACWICHVIIEAVDRGLNILNIVKKYLKLKEERTNENK